MIRNDFYSFAPCDGFQKAFFLDTATGLSRDLNVNGSGTAVTFDVPIDTTTCEKMCISLVLVCETAGGLGALDDFIDVSGGLTNGLLLQALDKDNNVVETWGNLKTNGDMISYIRNITEIKSTVPSYLYSIGFIAQEYSIIIKTGITKMRLTVRDDLSAITGLAASMTVIKPSYSKL